MHCLVKKETETVLASGKHTLKALRRLKKTIKACRDCPVSEDCLLKESIDEQVNEMVAEINAEWEVEL
jgi:hypothetical protein